MRNKRSPKSIFFEHERNTINLNSSDKSSIIEDLLYAEIDNNTSKIIKHYQTEDLTKLEFKDEDEASLLFFLITLFWRIPKTDYAANDLFEKSEIITNGIDTKLLKNDSAFKKISRVGLFKHHVDEIRKHSDLKQKWINIHKFSDEIFVLGDFPIVFNSVPDKFSEFNEKDYLIAINSKRIYSSTINSLENFTQNNAYRYNACVINQSLHYVSCSNYKVLEYSILLYKALKKTGHIFSLNQDVFVT